MLSSCNVEELLPAPADLRDHAADDAHCVTAAYLFSVCLQGCLPGLLGFWFQGRPLYGPDAVEEEVPPSAATTSEATFSAIDRA